MSSPVRPASSTAAWAYAHVVAVGERNGGSFTDRPQKLLAPCLQQSLNGAPGNTHHFRRLGLLFVFQVAQTHRFEFIEAEFEDFQLRKRDPRRLEQVESVHTAAIA